MKPAPTGKTIFKIRVGRRAREWVSAVKLLGGLGLLIGVVFVLQIGACKYRHPSWTVRACSKPYWGRK